jgi:iron-sulfur cluster repair protein YtfE (RIC family)
MDLLDELIQQHRQVEAMLETLAQSEPGSERQSTVSELVTSLSQHMQVEEDAVYPIVKETLGAEDETEAENEHQLARDGLAKLQELVDEPGFGAAVEMVKAGISHHVSDEEDKVFPRLRQEAEAKIAHLGSFAELLGNSSDHESANGSTGSTREELYEQAREAGIEGRSTMTKAELEKALGEG